MKTIYLLAWIINAVLLAVFCWKSDIAPLFILNIAAPTIALAIRFSIFQIEAEEDPIL